MTVTPLRISGSFLSFYLVMLGSPAWSQETLPLHEKEDVLHAISTLSTCLKSQQAACVAKSISIRGVALGVDGPRSSANSLVNELSRDHSTQCLFWGIHCNPSDKCSISDAISTLDSGSVGKPHLYGNHWQVDAESKPTALCSAGMPFVFQLENGYWKLVAIPYT